MHHLYFKNGTFIPEHELEIIASRSGGPGGQHVHKTSTRITVRWNVKNTTAFSPEEKELLLQKLQHEITCEGNILVSNSSSRSQRQNKEMALQQLAHTIKKALFVPKKRKKHIISYTEKEKRLHEKKNRSFLKKQRGRVQE